MRAVLLCAGLGTRLEPATSHSPKALFRFLNVPLVDRRLRALVRQGVTEVAVNLHHEGRQIVEHLSESGASGAAIRFFWEPEILGTAGAVKNAESFFEEEEFAIWNVDAEAAVDFAALRDIHRREGNIATLLVTASPDPRRFTPLYAEGGSRLSAIGGTGHDPLLFTGVSLLSRRALDRIAPGPRSLVEDLWRPLLAEGRERIGIARLEGSAFDLGSPADVLAASLSAVETRCDFDSSEGVFDRRTKVLAADTGVVPVGADRCVIGRARIAGDARIADSVLLDGAEVGSGCVVTRSLIGPVRLEPGERVDRMFLWPAVDGSVRRMSLHDSSQRGDPAVK
jgi:mannose-1-phosphate guanylyltransferase